MNLNLVKDALFPWAVVDKLYNSHILIIIRLIYISLSPIIN